MKSSNLGLFIGLLILFNASCTPYQSLPTYYKRLSYPELYYIYTLPIERHNNPIHLFFNGEIPDQPHINFAKLEVKPVSPITYDDKIKLVKKKAKYIGADGILILTSKSKATINSSKYGVFSYANTNQLDAIAIKYMDSLKTYSQYPKKEIYFSFDKKLNRYHYAFTNLLSMNGDIYRREKSNPYDKDIHQFSLFYLLKEENQHWTSIINGSLVFARQYQNESTRSKATYHFIYDSTNRVANIINQKEKIEIVLNYNDANQLVQKKIYGDRILQKKDPKGKMKYAGTRKKLQRIETLKYDSLNRLVEKEVVKISDEGEEIPWVKVFYTDFYTKADVLALSIKDMEQ